MICRSIEINIMENIREYYGLNHSLYDWMDHFQDGDCSRLLTMLTNVVLCSENVKKKCLHLKMQFELLNALVLHYSI